MKRLKLNTGVNVRKLAGYYRAYAKGEMTYSEVVERTGGKSVKFCGMIQSSRQRDKDASWTAKPGNVREL